MPGISFAGNFAGNFRISWPGILFASSAFKKVKPVRGGSCRGRGLRAGQCRIVRDHHAALIPRAASAIIIARLGSIPGLYSGRCGQAHARAHQPHYHEQRRQPPCHEQQGRQASCFGAAPSSHSARCVIPAFPRGLGESRIARIAEALISAESQIARRRCPESRPPVAVGNPSEIPRPLVGAIRAGAIRPSLESPEAPIPPRGRPSISAQARPHPHTPIRPRRSSRPARVQRAGRSQGRGRPARPGWTRRAQGAHCATPIPPSP
jgi:hypothetical protein